MPIISRPPHLDIGIPETKFDHIFAAFEQADGSVARQYGGAGLGLAVTRQLVELHGGYIWVASSLGQGSRFTFTLPLYQGEPIPGGLKGDLELVPDLEQPVPKVRLDAELQVLNIEEQQPVAASETAPAVLGPQPGSISILAVDDEPVNLQVLSNYLSQFGYRVINASNGLEALDAIQHDPRPDLVLLDIMMPRMSGYEVASGCASTTCPTNCPS